MTDFTAPSIQRIRKRLKELFRDKKGGQLAIGFRLDTVAMLQDMPSSPRVSQFTVEDLHLLSCLRLELNDEFSSAEAIIDSDVVYFALQELQLALNSSRREDEVLRLRFQLCDTKRHRS
jgi:hypothetical protein